MKKIIACLLIFSLMCPLACGFYAHAASSAEITIGDYVIQTNASAQGQEKEAQLLFYTGTDAVLDIPEYIGEYKITSVYSGVLRKKTETPLHVETIMIPKTVVSVDEKDTEPLSACYDCTCIEVDEDNPVYASENGILYSKDKTKLVRVPCAYPGSSLTIKNGVQLIGKGALSDCLFTDISFPQTLVSIEARFMQNGKAEELYFPDSLVAISKEAFWGTEKTKFVYFGANTLITTGFVFNATSSIQEYAVSGENPYLSAQDGVLLNKDKTKLIAYPPAKKADTYTVPDSVLSIAKAAFHYCNVKTINTNLAESLDTDAFEGCNKRTTQTGKAIIFGENLASLVIDGSCYNAQSWTFLNKNCAISTNAFSGLKKTVYGYYGSTAYQFFYMDEKRKPYFDFVLLDEEPELGFGYTQLSNDTIRIDSFTGFDTSVEIPEYIDGKKVVQIGTNTFAGNTSITQLILPTTLETIDSYAFADLTQVETLTLPAGVNTVGSYALNGMSALKKLYVNSFACQIGENAFPAGTKVFACTGSTAQSYAGNHDLSFYSIGHQFVSEEIENNKIKKTCTLCGYSEITDNPNIHHDYESVVTEPTCTEQGYTTYTCTICGDTYTTDYKAALGHEPFEIKATSPTCTVEGKTAGIQCARCSLVLKEQEVIAKLPHEYDGGITTVAPTCTEAGVKTFTCRNCDDFYTQPVAKVPHQYLANVKEPTCTQAGYTTYTCAMCGDAYEADEVPAVPHVPEEIPAVAATCRKEGSTIGSRCAVCGLVLQAPIATEKVPHRYISVVKKPASFSQNGVMNEECSMCALLRKSTVVKSLKSMKLSATVLIYSGKKLTAPKVTVTDSAGKTVSAKYYTVSYISRANGKAVSSISAIGQYKVKVIFKDAYSGTKYLYFTVKPRAITQYKPTTAKKAVTAKWKKDTSISGYQVMIATNKAFTAGKKTYTVKTNAITANTITGLKSGKTYYISIRAYKKITVDGKKLNIYSSYSSAKSVKCK